MTVCALMGILCASRNQPGDITALEKKPSRRNLLDRMRRKPYLSDHKLAAKIGARIGNVAVLRKPERDGQRGAYRGAHHGTRIAIDSCRNIYGRDRPPERAHH